MHLVPQTDLIILPGDYRSVIISLQGWNNALSAISYCFLKLVSSLHEIIPVASFRIIFFCQSRLSFFYFETTDIGFVHFEDQGIGIVIIPINENCCGPFQSQHVNIVNTKLR
jgi:hypothetical protein